MLSRHISLGFPSDLLSSGFPTKTLCTPLLYPVRATCSAHLILLDLTTRVIFGEQCRSSNSSLCSLLNSHVTLSLVRPNIFLDTLLVYSNTLSLRSSLNVRDQVSHPQKNKQMAETCCVKYLIIELLSTERQSLNYSSSWMSQRIA
jgi:hypothetical protein